MAGRKRRRRKAKQATTVRTGTWHTYSTESDSGIPVTTKGLMSYAPIFYGVGKVAGHLGVSPFELHRKVGGRLEPASGELDGIEDVINIEPNELMTSISLKELTQTNAMLAGNGRLGILRDGLGTPLELLPLDPERTSTMLIYEGDDLNGWLPAKWHCVTNRNGAVIKIPDRDCIHVLGLGGDGLSGWSLVELAANSIGSGIAGEKHVNRTYRNNAVPGLILEAPEGVFDDDSEAQDFLDNFQKFHAGIDKANRVGLLRYGVQAKVLAMTGKDAEITNQRKFSREEAALWTGIEQMLGVEDSKAYNTIGERNQAYFQNCLIKWVVKWEQEFDRKLLTPQQRAQGYRLKANLGEVLKASRSEQLENWMKERQMGLRSQEEIREDAGYGPIDPSHNFSNPQTTPGDTGDRDDSNAVEETEGVSNAEDRLRRVVQSQVERLLEKERDRLLDLGKTPDRFLDRVGEYYDRWETTLVAAVRSLGGADELAIDHIRASKEAVLGLTETVSGAAELAAGIDGLTRPWPLHRSRELTDNICKIGEPA